VLPPSWRQKARFALALAGAEPVTAEPRIVAMMTTGRKLRIAVTFVGWVRRKP
jgi:hypothetical protein